MSGGKPVTGSETGEEERAMGHVKRFEDLVAWQKGRELAVEIYRATGRGGLAGDFGLREQMQRSAVSVPSNIAEGFERGSAAEFHRSLSTAKGSCAELRTQLHIAHDVGYLIPENFHPLMAKAEEVGRIVGGLRSAVGKQRGGRRTKS
jgi:four helix bundle protein